MQYTCHVYYIQVLCVYVYVLKKEDCVRKQNEETNKQPQAWQKLVSSTVLTIAVASLGTATPSMADLNRFEAATRGEFGIGSAAQFGSADLK